MSQAQIALIISGLSLLVALTALYRAELRGPNLKLVILQSPTSWQPHWQWKSPTQGRWELYVSFSGWLAVVVENSGPRSGVIFDPRYRVEPVPEPFKAEVLISLEGLTQTVAGKASESISCQIMFSRENVTIAEALRAFVPDGPDFQATIIYKANRAPFGRIRSGNASQTVSRKPLSDCVKEWARNPPPPPLT